jgi:hypothetical protein
LLPRKGTVDAPETVTHTLWQAPNEMTHHSSTQ